MSRDAAVAVLRAVARRTFRALPVAVRKTLNGVPVRLAHLGRTPDGGKILGMARDDGRMVLLDARTVGRHAGDQEPLEDLLAHELAHAYRALQGLSDPDDEREEAAADRLAKSWGFHPQNQGVQT